MKEQKKCVKCGNLFNINPWSEGKELTLCMPDKIIDDMFGLTNIALSQKTRGGRPIEMSWGYISKK